MLYAVSETPPPVAANRTSLSALREALGRADYTTERIESMLGVGELSALPEDVEVQRRRLRGDPFSTLARLFLLGDAVELGEAEAALAPASLDELGQSGLLDGERDHVRASV